MPASPASFPALVPLALLLAAGARPAVAGDWSEGEAITTSGMLMAAVAIAVFGTALRLWRRYPGFTVVFGVPAAIMAGLVAWNIRHLPPGVFVVPAVACVAVAGLAVFRAKPGALAAAVLCAAGVATIWYGDYVDTQFDWPRGSRSRPAVDASAAPVPGEAR